MIRADLPWPYLPLPWVKVNGSGWEHKAREERGRETDLQAESSTHTNEGLRAPRAAQPGSFRRREGQDPAYPAQTPGTGGPNCYSRWGRGFTEEVNVPGILFTKTEKWTT